MAHMPLTIMETLTLIMSPEAKQRLIQELEDTASTPELMTLLRRLKA